MPDYDSFARFYDAAMDDPGPRAERVQDWIDRFRPGSTSLLELGCGTGSILARLDRMPSLTGLDRSPDMLTVASQKVPGARLIEGNMASFSLGRQFDVIICVFDSLNHLMNFEAWESMFASVHRHLVEDGLFLFDVNTVGELRRLDEETPWVLDFDEHTLILDVTYDGDGTSLWDIRIFESIGNATYQLHHERIGEVAFDLMKIHSSIHSSFTVLETMGEDGEPATDQSVKCHFALRRKPHGVAQTAQSP